MTANYGARPTAVRNYITAVDPGLQSATPIARAVKWMSQSSTARRGFNPPLCIIELNAARRAQKTWQPNNLFRGFLFSGEQRRKRRFDLGENIVNRRRHQAAVNIEQHHRVDDRI